MCWQPRGVWKNFDFRQLWLGQTISKFGDGMTGIALPLVAVLVLQATPQQVGILTALNGTAVLVFGLLAGVWVDRLRRRPLMIATDLGRALLLVSIPLAALAGCLSLGQLYGVAALVGWRARRPAQGAVATGTWVNGMTPVIRILHRHMLIFSLLMRA